MPTPDPDLGWKILAEYAGRLPSSVAGFFESRGRDREFFFTKGLVTEAEYRSRLERDLPSEEEISDPDSYYKRLFG